MNINNEQIKNTKNPKSNAGPSLREKISLVRAINFRLRKNYGITIKDVFPGALTSAWLDAVLNDDEIEKLVREQHLEKYLDNCISYYASHYIA